MAEDENRLLAREGHESDYIDFEAPDIAEESPPKESPVKPLKLKPQRIVLKYPDGSQSLGKSHRLGWV